MQPSLPVVSWPRLRDPWALPPFRLDFFITSRRFYMQVIGVYSFDSRDSSSFEYFCALSIFVWAAVQARIVLLASLPGPSFSHISRANRATFLPTDSTLVSTSIHDPSGTAVRYWTLRDWVVHAERVEISEHCCFAAAWS